MSHVPNPFYYSLQFPSLSILVQPVSWALFSGIVPAPSSITFRPRAVDRKVTFTPMQALPVVFGTYILAATRLYSHFCREDKYRFGFSTSKKELGTRDDLLQPFKLPLFIGSFTWKIEKSSLCSANFLCVFNCPAFNGDGLSPQAFSLFLLLAKYITTDRPDPVRACAKWNAPLGDSLRKNCKPSILENEATLAFFCPFFSFLSNIIYLF